MSETAPNDPPMRPVDAAHITHGVNQMVKQGLKALSRDDLLAMLEIRLDLSTREGQAEALRHRVGMGLLMLRNLEAFVAAEAEKGRPLDRIEIFARWPAFQNSTLRALKQLGDLPDPNQGRNLDELKRIDAKLKDWKMPEGDGQPGSIGASEGVETGRFGDGDGKGLPHRENDGEGLRSAPDDLEMSA